MHILLNFASSGKSDLDSFKKYSTTLLSLYTISVEWLIEEIYKICQYRAIFETDVY